MSFSRSSSSYLRAAGLILLAIGVLYVLAEAISASAFSPPYSYTHNFISDLGVTGCGGGMQGRPICSPLHDVMNWTFMLEGAGFIAAAVIVARAEAGIMRLIFLLLSTIHGVGIIMVGVFHGSDAAVADGTGVYHVLGASMAIIGGNLAVLTSAALPPWRNPVLRNAAIILPVIGLAGLAALVKAQADGAVFIFDNGILERASVYSITAWQILSGLYLLRTRSAALQAAE